MNDLHSFHLHQGGIGTAGPTIVHALNGSDFTWVASAYALAAAACIPLSGNMSQMLGRRIVILGGIIIFAIGSAVCGSAHTLPVLIVGRGEWSHPSVCYGSCRERSD